MSERSFQNEWGNVPPDADVRPFSGIRAAGAKQNRNNKRHHYISVTYMLGFADRKKRVWAYRADAPQKPLYVPPSNVGYERYYYSQKLPDGGQENHRFEDFWNAIETVWPETLRAIHSRRISPAISFNTLGMATIMRTRVPAARERNEVLLAAKLRAEVQALEAMGSLPPEFQRYAGQLDTVPVGVNPQQTLLAMTADFNQFGDLCFQIGFEVLHNDSGIPFITSDNPVCVYDPRLPPGARRPYEFDGEVELIFPLDARTLLRGSGRLAPVNQLIRHRQMSDAVAVRRVNRTIAQFSYGLLLAQDRTADQLATRYADKVPTVEFEVKTTKKNIEIVWSNVFGPRPGLYPYVDTPEKAARLEALMAASAQVAGGV